MLDRLRREDDGFTLVETLAAMIVFAMLAVSVGGVILNGFQLTKSNASRVAAANLAAQRIEAAHASPPSSIPDGLTVEPPQMINGVAYTVERTANYVQENAGTSLCDGAAAATGVTLAYKLITVVVTWPSMGRVKPVRQDTLLNLGVGGGNVTKGVAAVGVKGATGNPVSGVTVTLMPNAISVLTGADGCAVFPNLAPGAYSAKVGQDGFVTPGGALESSASFTVAADTVQRVELAYERAGSLSMALAGPEGLLPPPNLGMTLSTAGFTPTAKAFVDCAAVSTSPYLCVSGAPRTATRLWPGSYDVQPGPCPQNTTSTAQAVVTSSTTASATLPLAGARVEVRTKPTADPVTDGAPASGYTVYAVRAGDGVCAPQSWPLAPAGSSAQSLALPPGAWTFALTADASAPDPTYPWPTVTLPVGGPVPNVVVRVP